ncbi:hypothetical protein AM609_03880 [Actinomyces sp. oral taxon 414]|uniref:polyphenol oxidase family protein n=1 Tax=Actinomyces sp. oral taxon 414 TaxID=712122 RepID=UPI0006AEAC31|nr:polyphenol oxidase family protein [Actinomyces sp. oral taxon 414]ALD00544.1 hypothetical protein AM609_03880 [Actinomyces sp. oral taxon 414]
MLAAALGPRARGCFTTRGAGAPPVSARAPYAGLNLALHVGDDAARVGRARRRLEEALGLGRRTGAGAREPGLAWMNQVHSAVVARARPQDGPDDAPAADALVLSSRDSRDRPPAPRPAGVAVMVADCVPLLLAADDGTVVAAVHAGRRGMLDGVVTAAVEAMAGLGADPAGLWAAIGPAICGSCYEVPERMRDEAAAREPACAAVTRWGTPGLDIAAGVAAQLRRAGVRRIDRPGWCTYEDRRFYSHRRDGTTGRIVGAALVAPTGGVE